MHPRSARNRPAHLGAGALPANRDPAVESAARQLLAAGLAPETVAAAVVDAIRTERLYVFPAPELKERFRARMNDVLADRPPRPSGSVGLPQPAPRRS